MDPALRRDDLVALVTPISTIKIVMLAMHESRERTTPVPRETRKKGTRHSGEGGSQAISPSFTTELSFNQIPHWVTAPCIPVGATLAVALRAAERTMFVALRNNDDYTHKFSAAKARRRPESRLFAFVMQSMMSDTFQNSIPLRAFNPES
jgi:hypothetical protein